MTYFSTPALTQGESWSANLDTTWTDTTISYVFSGWDGSGVNVTVNGSTDEGATWFQLTTLSAASSVTPVFLTGKPVNAIKVSVVTLGTGFTLTASVTGAP